MQQSKLTLGKIYKYTYIKGREYLGSDPAFHSRTGRLIKLGIKDKNLIMICNVECEHEVEISDPYSKFIWGTWLELDRVDLEEIA